MSTQERKPSEEELWRIDQAVGQIAEMKIPQLIGNDSHERIIFASFDGTDRNRATAKEDGRVRTAIGRFADELDAKERANPRIASLYQRGVGDNLADDALGYTAKQKMEAQYAAVCKQAAQWRAEDPNVKIRVVSMGYSRGADQAAAFTRMIDERGIQDPENPEKKLMPAKSVPQGAILLDPVATGALMLQNRKLPGSVMFAVQVVSSNERRILFPSSNLVPMGLSKDGRMLSVMAPGGHGDSAHDHAKDGASVKFENALTDVLNTAVGSRLLPKVPQSGGEYMRLHESDMFLDKLLRNPFGGSHPGARGTGVPGGVFDRCEAEKCFELEPANKKLFDQFKFKVQDHAPVHFTDGPGHVQLMPHGDGMDQGLRGTLGRSMEVMEELKSSNPDQIQVPSAQLAAAAMRHWQSTGATGMFNTAALVQSKDGSVNLVLSDTHDVSPSARRESVPLAKLGQESFEQNLAELVQAQAQAQANLRAAAVEPVTQQHKPQVMA